MKRVLTTLTVLVTLVLTTNAFACDAQQLDQELLEASETALRLVKSEVPTRGQEVTQNLKDAVENWLVCVESDPEGFNELSKQQHLRGDVTFKVAVKNLKALGLW